MNKKLQLSFSIILIGFFISLSSFNTLAQGWGSIDSLKIIPVNPTSTSTVLVSCFATFGYGSCYIIDSSVNISDTIITVQAYHLMGMLTVICNSADTLILGSNFSPGTYTVVYNLNDSGSVALDTDTLYFTIPVAESITEHITPPQLNIFPNPASNELAIHFRNAEIATNITITDVLGREIYSQKTNQNSEIINIKSLSAGVYFVKAQLQKGKVVSGKFVKEEIIQ